MFFAQFAHEVINTQLLNRTALYKVFKTTLARQWYAKRLVREQIYIYIVNELKFKKLSRQFNT
jgi:hypothetical protein